MRRESIALAVIALLAGIGPACAGTGFYVGLGAGWDGQNNVNLEALRPPFINGEVATNDGLIIAGTLGFKLPYYPIRIEFESGYNWHTVSSVNFGGTSFAASGNANIASELFNAVYDFPVGPAWNLYAGGGIGPGHVHFTPTLSVNGERVADIDHWAFMWQLIAGTSFEITPNTDIFVDYRYRDARAEDTLRSSFGLLTAGPTTENVIMAGVRFYTFPPFPFTG